MSQIHILDKSNFEIKEVLSNKAENKVVLQDTHTRNIETYSETYDFILDYRASEGLENRDRVLIPDEIKGYYREFIINKTDTDTADGETEVFSEASYFEDLQKAKPIAPQTLTQATPKSAVEFALTGTGWQLGEVEYSGFRTISWTSFNTPFEVLKILANRFEAQLDFSIETRGNKVTKRLVHLRQPKDLFSGKEIRRGKDLEDLQRSTLSTDVVTALVAIAPEPQEEDGVTPERLIIEVKDDEAQAKWGKTYNYLWGIYEPESNDGEMTETRLRTLATTELNKHNKPKVEYSISAVSIEEQFPHERVLIGDKIRLKDDLSEPYFYVDATIKEVTRSVFDKHSKSYVLGEITEHDRIDLRKYFQNMLGELRERLKNTNSNLDNIVTIIDTEVERRIHRGDTPPENPINGQLWMDTSDRDRVIIKEYFNGEWIERITNVHDAEDIGAITREQAMYEAILSAFENFKVLHSQLMVEALAVKDNKYINQTHIDNINAKLQQVISTYELIRDELAAHEDDARITLDVSNYLHQLMLDYSSAVSSLRTALQEANEFAMAHLAYLQSQYTDEKYDEALSTVADKFGLTYEDGILLGNAVLMSDLESTRDSLEQQLKEANTTLTDMVDSITGDSRNMIIGTSLIDDTHFSVVGGHTILADEPLEYVRITKDVEDKEVVNLYDELTTTANTRIRLDGVKSTDTNHVTSDFIAVKPNSRYRWYTSNASIESPRIIFYNSDKQYQEGILYVDDWNINFTTPNNASHIKLTAPIDNYNASWTMEEGFYAPVAEGNEAYILFHNRMDYTANETYTLALDFRSDVVDELDYIFLSTSSSTHILHETMIPAPFELEATGEWNRYYMQFTPTEDIPQAQLKVGTDYTDDVIGEFDIRQIHLYKGTNEMAWLPAPEDNRQFITQLSREITDMEHKLASKLTREDYDVLAGDISSLNTEIIQTADSITQKADKSYVDTVNKTVTNHSTQLTTHAEGIDTLITKTNTQDGKLTTITNTATETAEGLAQTITKVTQAEGAITEAKGAITQAQADIVANATEISNKLSSADYTLDQEDVVQKLNMASSERIQMASEIQDRVTLADYKIDKVANAGALNTLATSITQNGKDIALRATKEELDGVDKTLKASHAELKLAHDNITSEVAGLSDNLTEVSTTVTQNKDAFDVSIEENTTKFSQIDDNLVEKVGKSEIVTSINASIEGVKIKGDLVEITAGSSINLAIQGAKDYADGIASNAEQSAKDYALAELNKARIDGRNIYAISDRTVGTRIHIDGKESKDNNHTTSGFLSVTPEATYVWHSAHDTIEHPRVIFYDRNKKYLEGVLFESHYLVRFDVPKNAYFIRVTAPTDNIDDSNWMVEKGKLPSTYSTSLEDLVQKDKIIAEINLDESGAQISGDKIELTAGSAIKLAIDSAIKHADAEMLEAKKYADTAAKKAKEAAEDYAKTKAEAERVIAEAHADGIVTAEERARINDVNAKLETAKEHANTKADAAEKAATAVANSKVAPNEVIPSINLDKTGAQIDGNKIALSAGSAIKLAIDAAEDKAIDHSQKLVDELEIGGTNLIPKTDFGEYINPPNGWSTWGNGTTLNNRIQFSDYILVQNNSLTSSIGFTSDRLNEEIIEGQTYTISFLASTSAHVNSAMNYTYLMNDGDGVNHSFPTPKREFVGNIGSNAIYKYTTTRVAPFGGQAHVLIGSDSVTQGAYGYIYMSKPQLEIGNKATAWSKAHRDTVSKERIIAEINLDKSGTKISGDMVDINANRINLSANESFKLVAGDAKKALTDAKKAQDTANASVPKTGVVTAINASRESMKISADKLELIGGKSISIRLNDADKAASNAQSTANTANKKANDVGDELNNLDAAGTNMLQHTNFSDLRNIKKMGTPWGSGASYSRSNEYILVTTSNSGSQLGMRTMDNELYFEPNTKYTLSFKAYSSGYTTGDFNYVYIYRPDGSNEGSFATKRVKLGDAPQKGYTLYEYRVTFTSTKDHDKPAQMLIADTTTRTGASTWVRIKDIMLQKGNLATPYALHPSEVVEKRNIIPEINLNDQGAKIQGDKIKLVAGDEISLEIADTQKKIIGAHVPNRNLIQNGDLWNSSKRFFDTHTSTATDIFGTIGNPPIGKGWVRMQRSDGNLSYMWTHNGGRNRFTVTAGKTYTFSVLVTQNYHGNDLNYVWIRRVADSRQINLTNHLVSKTLIGEQWGRPVYRYVYTFDVPWTSNEDTVMFMGMNNASENSRGYYLSEWKLEEGTEATAYDEELASKQDLISQVNLDSSGVNISGNKISLTGTAEFNSAFGKNRGITAISGGRIETDSMRAKRIEIVRPDGAVAVNNGLMRNDFVVASFDPPFSSFKGSQFNPKDVFTRSGVFWRFHKDNSPDYDRTDPLTYNAYSFNHSGRYLLVEVNLQAPSNGTGMFMELYEFSTPSGVTRFHERQGFTLDAISGTYGKKYHTFKVDLGVPSYKRRNFYLRVNPNHQGVNTSYAEFRILRMTLSD